MAQLTYSDLVDRCPKAHFVVGTIDDRANLTGGRLVAHLVKALAPKGDYAIGELQAGPGFQVHCIFQLREDADRLAAAVHATPSRHARWDSQRSFRLNAQARKAISAVLSELRAPKR